MADVNKGARSLQSAYEGPYIYSKDIKTHAEGSRESLVRFSREKMLLDLQVRKMVEVFPQCLERRYNMRLCN